MLYYTHQVKENTENQKEKNMNYTYLTAETTWRMMDIAAYTFVLGYAAATGELPDDDVITESARAIMDNYCSSEDLVPCYEEYDDEEEERDEDEW
jgi:hypothetical protein